VSKQKTTDDDEETMSGLFEFPDRIPDLQDFAVEWSPDRSEKSLLRATGDQDYERGTKVGLPAKNFDCYAIDALGEHEAVDPLIRQDLQRGVLFRLIRIPCSISPGPRLMVTRARVTASLKEDAEPSAQIYSISPTKIEVEGETVSEISIGPSLDILHAVKVSGFKWAKRIKMSQPRSLVTGFWFPTGAEWILEPGNDSRGLERTWNFLFTLRWSHQVRPLSVEVRVVIEATPVEDGLFRRLFLRSRTVQHLYRAWDPATCSDALRA
jgi:hypothetical protein